MTTQYDKSITSTVQAFKGRFQCPRAQIFYQGEQAKLTKDHSDSPSGESLYTSWMAQQALWRSVISCSRKAASSGSEGSPPSAVPPSGGSGSGAPRSLLGSWSVDNFLFLAAGWSSASAPHAASSLAGSWTAASGWGGAGCSTSSSTGSSASAAGSSSFQSGGHPFTLFLWCHSGSLLVSLAFFLYLGLRYRSDPHWRWKRPSLEEPGMGRSL